MAVIWHSRSVIVRISVVSLSDMVSTVLYYDKPMCSVS